MFAIHRWRAACASLALLAAVPVLDAQMIVGTNLNSSDSYSPSRIFINVFEQLTGWKSKNATGSSDFDTLFASSASYDANKWPLSVPFTPAGGVPQTLHVAVDTTYAPGTYRLTWQGYGAFKLSPVNYNAANTISVTAADVPGSRTFTITSDTKIRLDITATSPGADGQQYLRNFKLVPTGLAAAYDAGQRIRDDYIERRRYNRVIRFMDWMNTNGSPVVEWADRTRTTYYGQGACPAGVAYEYLVDLTNRTGAEPWVTIPHKASDDYIRQFARYLRDNLNPHTRIWVEYSNETWNSDFAQYWYGIEAAKAAGIYTSVDPKNDWKAAHYYTVYRSSRIWQIFKEEFGSASHRIVKVLGTQAGNTGVVDIRLASCVNPTFNPTGVMPDYIAGAPYFGRDVTSKLIAAGILDTASVDTILDYLTERMRSDGIPRAVRDIAHATPYGVAYVTYEGGQHMLVNGAPDASKASLNARYAEANKSPRMYDIYREYLDGLKNAGVELYMNYLDISPFNNHGYWGGLWQETLSVDKNVPGFAPKAAAIIDWANANAPLLAETFSDGDSNGWTMSYAPGFGVVNGRLAVKSSGGLWALWDNATAKTTWGDCHVSLDVTPASSSNSFGVFFRAVSNFTGYRLLFTGSTATLSKVGGGVTTPLKTATVAPVIGQENHIDVYARGSTFTVYLNGTDVFGPVTDTTYAKGTVGLISNSNIGTAFDQVFVWPE